MERLNAGILLAANKKSVSFPRLTAGERHKNMIFKMMINTAKCPLSAGHSFENTSPIFSHMSRSALLSYWVGDLFIITNELPLK